MVTIQLTLYLKQLGGVQSVVDPNQLNQQYYIYIQENFQNLGYEETYKHLTHESFKSIKQVFEDAKPFSQQEYLDYESFKNGAENALRDYRHSIIKEELKKEIRRATESVSVKGFI